jgi:hypothetical protein
VQNFQNVGVSGNDPGVQERVPMDGIFGPQAAKQRIWVSQHLRLEEMI